MYALLHPRVAAELFETAGGRYTRSRRHVDRDPPARRTGRPLVLRSESFLATAADLVPVRVRR